MIIIHHNATTNYQVAIDTWLVSAGNNTSAHYEITDNQIIGVVPEYNIAYHAGNWNVNTRSIGLEHVNATVGPPDAMYTVSQTTLKNSAKLCADICRNYNIPIDRDHIKGHNEVSDTGTFCPGTINMDNYVQLVKNY